MSSPETHITPDSININIGVDTSSGNPPTTIFFIPGNPGLISYYYSFLPLLSEYLQSSKTLDVTNGGLGPGFRICGTSLGGFEVEGGKESNSEGKEQRKALYGLREQIEFVERSLWNAVKNPGLQSNAKPRVILTGHSVGAYIAMEILRRYREREAKYGLDQLEIVGGVLLFPTVVDIAKSPSGKKATWLIGIPKLAMIISLLAKVLLFFLPGPLLGGLINLAMGFPPKTAVDTTVNFLRSERGVRQAIHMAGDEMREITSDNWSDDIWGTASPKVMDSSDKTIGTTTLTPPPPLLFYFGRGDHWVAEQTRDELIKARGSLPDKNGKRNGPKMLVCEDGILHGFCIRHNDIMAKKVAGFIHEIVDGLKN